MNSVSATIPNKIDIKSVGRILKAGYYKNLYKTKIIFYVPPITSKILAE